MDGTPKGETEEKAGEIKRDPVFEEPEEPLPEFIYIQKSPQSSQSELPESPAPRQALGHADFHQLVLSAECSHLYGRGRQNAVTFMGAGTGCRILTTSDH